MPGSSLPTSVTQPQQPHANLSISYHATGTMHPTQTPPHLENPAGWISTATTMAGTGHQHLDMHSPPPGFQKNTAGLAESTACHAFQQEHFHVTQATAAPFTKEFHVSRASVTKSSNLDAVGENHASRRCQQAFSDGTFFNSCQPCLPVAADYQEVDYSSAPLVVGSSAASNNGNQYQQPPFSPTSADHHNTFH